MPFTKLSITVEEALAEAAVEGSGWQLLPELDHHPEAAQIPVLDATELRRLQALVEALPFPGGSASPEERNAWYAAVNSRLNGLGAFIAQTRSLKISPPTTILFADSGLRVDLHRLCVIGDDFPLSALPFLRQCAVCVGERGRWDGKETDRQILGMYAVLAGADAVDDLLSELQSLPPISELDGKAYYAPPYALIADLLVWIAPANRFPELARIMRDLFEAIGPQSEEKKYGDLTNGQRILASIAYAYAIFDSQAAPVIRARMSEYGDTHPWSSGLSVRWGLAGITPMRVVEMLRDAGAIEPIRPVECQSVLHFLGIRQLFWHQNRFLVLGNDYYLKVICGDKTHDVMDATLLTRLSIRIARPHVVLEHVMVQQNRVRFAHGQSVFECVLNALDECDWAQESGDCVNQFLASINHPQRLFLMQEGYGDRDEKELAAFACADKERFSELIRQLELKAELPQPVSTSKAR